MTSKARSEEAMQPPPGSLGRFILGDIEIPWTVMLERAQVGTLVDSPR